MRLGYTIGVFMGASILILFFLGTGAIIFQGMWNELVPSLLEGPSLSYKQALALLITIVVVYGMLLGLIRWSKIE